MYCSIDAVCHFHYFAIHLPMYFVSKCATMYLC